MKLARGVARAIGALVVVIGMTLGIGTAEAVAPTGGLIRVQALVDGRSQLVLQGDTARWHHFDFAAPGRLGFANAPTTIDGVDWYPQWPDIPDAENRECNCSSDVFAGLNPPLPQTDVVVSVIPVQARGPVSIVQPPTSQNGYTLIVEFDDNAPPGAVWYVIDINVGVGSANQLSLGLYQGPQGAKTLAYANAGSLTSGDVGVSPSIGRPTSVNGTGTLPSASGAGEATITFDLASSDVTSGWSGTLTVRDPGSAFSATIPIHAGKHAIVRRGSVTDGRLFSIKALSVPRRCFMILFAIDDLA
jgi:hypothetical protein